MAAQRYEGGGVYDMHHMTGRGHPTDMAAHTAGADRAVEQAFGLPSGVQEIECEANVGREVLAAGLLGRALTHQRGVRV